MGVGWRVTLQLELQPSVLLTPTFSSLYKNKGDGGSLMLIVKGSNEITYQQIDRFCFVIYRMAFELEQSSEGERLRTGAWGERAGKSSCCWIKKRCSFLD